MISATIKIEGLKELEQKLKVNLPAAVSEKALRWALMEGVKPIQQAARDKVRKDPRTPPDKSVEDAIRRASKKRHGTFAGEAGIRMKTSGKAAGWKWHWLEFGVDPHSTRKGADLSRGRRQASSLFVKARIHPGHKPFPFLRPAFAEQIDNAVRIFKEQLALRIDRAWKKLNPDAVTEPRDEE